VVSAVRWVAADPHQQVLRADAKCRVPNPARGIFNRMSNEVPQSFCSGFRHALNSCRAVVEGATDAVAAFSACWIILLVVGAAADGSPGREARAMLSTFRAAVPAIDVVLIITGLLYVAVATGRQLSKVHVPDPAANMAFTLPERVAPRKQAIARP